MKKKWISPNTHRNVYMYVYARTRVPFTAKVTFGFHSRWADDQGEDGAPSQQALVWGARGMNPGSGEGQTFVPRTKVTAHRVSKGWITVNAAA